MSSGAGAADLAAEALAIALDDEAVMVDGVGLEPGDPELHTVVVVGGGELDVAAVLVPLRGDGALGIGEQLELDLDVVRGVDAGPQDHRRGAGITRRDRLREVLRSVDDLARRR